MIGTQIGSYLIQEKLGEGGMGTVYRALETNLDRIVAVKVLKADVAQDATIAERFRSEARAQANLNHTNIATLYTFLIHDGSPVMVMEYIDGESFQQIVRRRGPMPPEEAVPLFRQALLGIGAAHRMGIIHRDIKPSNLMLSRSGIVKVMDFGIAKITSNTHGPTRTGMQMGTLFYMSPEQVKGERVDIRSDIYALGVTLYELITGNVPFSSDSEFQILNDHVNTPPPPPSQFHPYLPKGLENIILKALSKSPADRFATVEDFGTALEHMDSWGSSPLTSSASLNATIFQAFDPKTPATGASFAEPGARPFPATIVESSPASRFASAPPVQPPQYLPIPPQNIPAANSAPARPLSGKVIAAGALLCLLGGAAFLYSNNKSLVSPEVSVPTPSGKPAVATPLLKPAVKEKTAPAPPDAAPIADPSPLPPEKSSLANEPAKQLGASTPPHTSTSRIPSQPPPASPIPAPTTSAPPQTPPPTTQQAPKPTSSSAEIDEARSRFIRLRSKALALKNSLGELRQRLASQGMSVNNDALEAEGNMDSYMQEADRALQSGDASAAQTNLDRAEHETKKLAAVFGR